MKLSIKDVSWWRWPCRSLSNWSLKNIWLLGSWFINSKTNGLWSRQTFVEFFVFSTKNRENKGSKLTQHIVNLVKLFLVFRKDPFWILFFLTHFMPPISFDTPWKHQKTRGFLVFSGGIKRDQWHEMGYFIYIWDMLYESRDCYC